MLLYAPLSKTATGFISLLFPISVSFVKILFSIGKD